MKHRRVRFQFRLRFLLLCCIAVAMPLALFSASDHHRRALVAIHNDDVNSVRRISVTHPDAIRANRYAYLLQTAYQNCSTEMIELLTGHYRPEDLNREASLVAAIRSNRIDKKRCVELILNRGVSPSGAMADALSDRDASTLELILKRGAATDGEAVLHAASESLRAAIKEGDPSCLQLLLRCGAVADKDAVVEAASSGNFELFEPLVASAQLSSKDMCCVLHAALQAYAGDRIVDHLLDGRVSPNATCSACKLHPLETAWQFQGEQRAIDYVTRLIRAGADPIKADFDLVSVLLTAAREGQIEACRLLKQQGVAIDEAWKSNARRYWSNSSTLDTAETLLQIGCDPNTEIRHGKTALHCLAEAGGPWTAKHERLCNQMLRHGADVRAQDDHGYRPMDNSRIAAVWNALKVAQ